ncbi:MAG: Gfo/Idh/MocA family oxidoreductase [Oscillospiraceae bacterium]|nr:Gfo/Idh/MocA family oxidoreductase [Oscillospiraceae bacterium]
MVIIMKQYKAAIAGYGGMGRHHFKSICTTERIRFEGVYDIDPERMKLALSDGISKEYSSYQELLADKEIDLVLIATPNNFHMTYACQAMEAGKMVVCEKPVAMSSDELQEMMNCSAKTGVKLTVHQNRREDADYLEMRDAVEKGLLGKVFDIESRVTGARGIPNGWRQYAQAGGGMMLDWGVHLIDQMVMMMAPKKVTKIYCDMYHVNYKECDDGFKLIMHFEDGPSATIEVGTSHFIQAPRWYVCGDLGSLIIHSWDCNGTIVRAVKHEVHWEEEIIQTKAGPTKTMAPRAKNTTEEIKLDGSLCNADYDVFYRNLADVLDGTAQLRVKPEEAMRVIKIMEAAFESDRTRTVINCDI